MISSQRIEFIISVIMATLITGCVVVSCVHDLPAAVKAETDNQRHIASKSITHQGYNQYRQFVENNK